ncbi:MULTISPECIES: IclR family transcriptional regulator [Actinoalloteichus]|uniref:Glycerol operon regulatory protein n=1 Tax=Actinoalloteichus fjordicus TaxID=1612552 RepID=A0AAC9LF86_9PSEU|nr:MULTISPECIES: IclR family transcriptional regulator [Actinoalloteichus]APU15780.1 transcriptional regulator, IclR family [Actinoalloteichus fjordicus]APU21840.1 transcriptional regulator, IclR family [Actinoalloteichus sp. GBA129-24]
MALESGGGPHHPVKSADRALEILECLAEHGELTLGELRGRLGFPKSSLHALLHTLLDRRWVAQDGSRTRFSLGVRALQIGTAYVDADPVTSRCQGALDEIAQLTGEAVHLGRLDGADVVYLAKRESVHPLRLYSAIGRRLPAHATALGKAMLACLAPAEVRRIVGPSPEALTADTQTDVDALLAELALAAERGWASEHEENEPGVSCIAVPLRLGQETQDALSVTAPLARWDDTTTPQIIAALTRARDELERFASPHRRGAS